MKIEFITEEDFYVQPLFEEFISRFSSEFEIVRVSCCPIMGRRSRSKLARDLALLYGPLGFVRLLARHFTASLLSKGKRPRNSTAFYSIEQLCGAYEIPYAHIENPNAEEFVREVRQREADVLISVACPFILKNQLLKTPRFGCINLHHAPLPRYKGMMPTFWQLFHGEKSVGLTIHTMTEKIDEGQALYQDQMEIESNETLDHLIRRSKRRAAQCVAAVLQDLERGVATFNPLNQENGTYFSFPSREQIREFRRRGLRAI